MSKYIRISILTILFIVFAICSNSFATEMSNSIGFTQPMQQQNTNTNLENQDTNSSETNTENVSKTNNTVSNTSTKSSPTSSGSSKVTGVSALAGLPEANLGLNNILSILLIAIGVLLILFAIAILIRLKK